MLAWQEAFPESQQHISLMTSLNASLPILHPFFGNFYYGAHVSLGVSLIQQLAQLFLLGDILDALWEGNM